MPKGRTDATGRSWNFGLNSYRDASGRMVKRCNGCGREKARTREFWAPDARSFDGLHAGRCRLCQLAWQAKRNAAARLEVLAHYSGGAPRCACCCERTIEFLEIDHIDGGGNAHRLAVMGSKKGGSSFPQWLKKSGFPSGFQVLCANCNKAKARVGQCPHERDRLQQLRKAC